MSTPLPDASAVELAIARRLRSASVEGHGSRLITQYPVAAAEVVMAVVGPVLEARDAEIERLRGIAAEYVLTGKSGSEEGERDG